VVPAAHYFCGGVLTDVHGRTSLHGLYAIGECACTGLHGANRLASTSLLEALVWGVSSGKDLAHRVVAESGLPKALASSIPDWQHEGDERRDDPALVAQDWTNIRNTMWNYVGIARTEARLRRAFEDMRDLVRHIHDFYKRTRISRRLVGSFPRVANIVHYHAGGPAQQREHRLPPPGGIKLRQSRPLRLGANSEHLSPRLLSRGARFDRKVFKLENSE